MSTNIAMTAVHLVAGATSRRETFAAMAKHFEGEQRLSRALVEYAPAVERVYQALESRADLGDWLYDCVERYGAACLDLVYIGSSMQDHFDTLIDFANCAAMGTLTDEDRNVAQLAWHGLVSPFSETYSAAWVSTAHISARTMDVLNAMPADMIPYWVSPTLYGWIVRFDALATYSLSDDSTGPEEYLATSADLVSIGRLLATHGLQAAHLDADGPLIDGLKEYEH